MAKPQTKPQFASVLDMPASEVEAPPPLPVGSYIAVVQGQARIDKSAKKQTPFAEFTLKLLEALDDVNTDDLEKIGGIADKTMKYTIYDTEKTRHMYREFIEHCGVEIPEDGSSIGQLFAELPGRQVVVHVKHEPSQDGKRVNSRISYTSAVE